MNISVNTIANAASAHTQDSQPTDLTRSHVSPAAVALAPEQQREERERDEAGDVHRLLGREAERDQRPDRRRLPEARPVEEAEHHHQQREADRREVDVLAGEAREVEVRRPDRQQHGRRERRHAPELVAQEVRHRDHRGAHQRGRQPGGEVGVAEEREHAGGQVEPQRAVQDRHVLVVALGPQDPGEVGVLALVVVERAVAEVVEPQPERHRDQDDVGDQLAARAPHVARAARSRASPP